MRTQRVKMMILETAHARSPRWAKGSPFSSFWRQGVFVSPATPTTDSHLGRPLKRASSDSRLICGNHAAGAGGENVFQPILATGAHPMAPAQRKGKSFDQRPLGGLRKGTHTTRTAQGPQPGFVQAGPCRFKRERKIEERIRPLITPLAFYY